MIIEIFLIFFLLKKPFLLLTSVRILIKLQVLMVHGRILVEHFSCIHDRLLALSLIIILPHLGSILLLVLIVLVQIHDQMLSIKHRALVVVHHMTLTADVAMFLMLVLQLLLSHSVGVHQVVIVQDGVLTNLIIIVLLVFVVTSTLEVHMCLPVVRVIVIVLVIFLHEMLVVCIIIVLFMSIVMLVLLAVLLVKFVHFRAPAFCL